MRFTPDEPLTGAMRALLAAMLMAMLPGCYYVQAAQGQWSISRSAVPVADVIADPATDEQLRARLALTQEALKFGIEELGLPDNGSYRRYVDLGRDYIVVNVFATPTLSLEPRTWCHWFVGCLAYRGYFDRADAERYAARIADDYDVFTARVPAYSTLGRLRDPLLNTMLAYSDAGLANLLFHEMAHQILYVTDDTAFNESFATLVGEEGVRRWRRARGETPLPPDDDRVVAWRARQAAVAEVYAALEAVYGSDRAPAEQRALKAAWFGALAARWEEAGWPGRAPPNNAALAPGAVYNDLKPGFARLLSDCADDLECFYERVKALAALPKAERDAALAVSQ